MIVSAAALGCLMLGGCKTTQKCEGDACCDAKGGAACCDAKGGAACCDAKGGEACCANKTGDKAASLVPVNTICPIGGHGAEKMMPVSYKGQVIGFCCEDCEQAFAGMTDAKKDEILAKAVAQGAAAKKPG